jgi:hypothetical protein
MVWETLPHGITAAHREPVFSSMSGSQAPRDRNTPRLKPILTGLSLPFSQPPFFDVFHHLTLDLRDRAPDKEECGDWDDGLHHVIDDRIDARELAEKCKQNCHRQRFAESGRRQLPTARSGWWKVVPLHTFHKLRTLIVLQTTEAKGVRWSSWPSKPIWVEYVHPRNDAHENERARKSLDFTGFLVTLIHVIALSFPHDSAAARIKRQNE